MEKKKYEMQCLLLLEASIDAIVAIDSSGKIIIFNKAAERIFGYSRKEIIGKNVEILMPEEYRERHRKGMERFLKTGKTKLIGKITEIEALRRNGEKFPIEISLSYYKLEGDYYFISIIRDISEKKKLEKIIEAKVKELEKANKLKDLFTDIISHDLVNPLGVIKSYADALLESERDEEKKEFIKRIIRNSEKVLDIIISASKYAKLETYKKLDFEEQDIADILKKSVEEFKDEIENKKIKIKIENKTRSNAKAEVNRILADAFSNLISNAIKYSPSNEVIEVKIEEKDGSLLISVADHGEGVKEEHKKDIFERFKRFEKAGVKGTGLGLAIAKRIVELHHGKIWVADNKPKGAIFFVELPKKH